MERTPIMRTGKLIEVPRAAALNAYTHLRHSLAQVAFLQSGYYLLRAIREAATDSSARGRAELDREHERREDPWDYNTATYQRDRIGTELAMLDNVRGGGKFANALEVGCSEGIFTELLASQCESLIAVDISPVALDRARWRLAAAQHVRFAGWDLRVDALPDTYDLIVMIHALEYIRNPITVRKARNKLVDSLRPGGHLLIGTMRMVDVYEDSWWSPYFLRSGQRINTYFARHPALNAVQTKEFQLGIHVAYDALFQKTP